MQATLTINITSTAALSRFQPVQANGAPAAAAGHAIGFCQTAATQSGERVPVVAGGTAAAIASAAIAVGDAVEVATDTAKVATRSAGVAIGRALTAATADGDSLEVLIVPN